MGREASGIVVLTGVKTYFGKMVQLEMVQLVQIARPKLHMEEAISMVLWLLAIVITLLGTAIIFSILRGINLLESFP